MEPVQKGIVRTTTLELSGAPHAPAKLQLSMALSVMEARNISISFYRYLYGEIGKSHYWFVRNRLSDSDLARILHDPNVKIYILYCDGSPAGFAEYNFFHMPQVAELVYFGLCPDFRSMGLGKWFLGHSLTSVWARNPDRIRVSTDTLDHERALPLYQKLGFAPVSIMEQPLEQWLTASKP